VGVILLSVNYKTYIKQTGNPIMAKQMQPGVIIMSTFPDQESILNVAQDLIVKKKLCACINLIKVRSLYVWKNKLEDQQEFMALFKTTKLSADKLKSEIKKFHPYEVPEIIEIKMNDVYKTYMSWISESTTLKATK
jgi:periplasmic divalent cation tolerance protein